MEYLFIGGPAAGRRLAVSEDMLYTHVATPAYTGPDVALQYETYAKAELRDENGTAYFVFVHAPLHMRGIALAELLRGYYKPCPPSHPL